MQKALIVEVQSFFDKEYERMEKDRRLTSSDATQWLTYRTRYKDDVMSKFCTNSIRFNNRKVKKLQHLVDYAIDQVRLINAFDNAPCCA